MAHENAQQPAIARLYGREHTAMHFFGLFDTSR